MNTLNTTNNSGSLPLERKKTFGSVLDNPEYIEKKDRIGFPEDDELNTRGFDANNGGQLIFNSPTTEVPQAFQKAFESEDISKLNPDATVPSEIFQSGVYTVLESTQNIVKKGVNTIGNLIEDSGGAFFDLAKTVAGKDSTETPQAFQKAFEGEHPSKLDPNIKPEKKPNNLENYSIIKKAEEVIANKQAEYKGEEMLNAALNPKRIEVADLANLQSGYKDVLDKNGEIRTDLQSVVEQKRKEIMQAQQKANQGPVISTSKKGGQGANLDQNKITEGVSVLSSNNAQ